MISLGTCPFMANGRRNGESLSQHVIRRLYRRNFQPGANLTAGAQEAADMFLETQRAFTFRSGGFHFNIVHRKNHEASEQHISWEITLKYCKFSEQPKFQ